MKKSSKTDIGQFKKVFINEAGSLLTNLDGIILELEKDPQNIHFINEAFRVMHTIKGASGMYGFDKIVEITHEIESIYDLVRNFKLEITGPLIDITLDAADHVRELLSDETMVNQSNIEQHQLLKEKIIALKQSSGEINTEKQEFAPVVSNIHSIATWNIFFYPDDKLIQRCVNLAYTFHDLFELGKYWFYDKPSDSDTGKDQYYIIFLVTDKTYDDIESALMFIMDFCKIIKIADFDIFDPESFKQREEFLINKSKENSTELLPVPSGRKTSEITKELRQSQNVPRDEKASIIRKDSTTHINVEASKLDMLMYLVSELVTTKSELLLALKKQNEQKALDAAEKIEKLSKLFGENALALRLVSLSMMLHKFKRLIRDLSKQLRKNIEFEIIGDDTELDKTIIDALDEPVMHLIRNCIDHGIELPEKRVERGKPETGIIRFEAHKTGNYVYITISDDGNGIDSNYIMKKAIEKGFIPEGTPLSQKEIYDLIFLPGFSTAESLSNVSGRGVGMDVVLKKIQGIRGEIQVESELGKGSSFSLKLQQSISIIDTLLITSGKITFAIPIEDIETCWLEPQENLLNRQNQLVEFNNSLIPFLNLRTTFFNETTTRNETEKLIIINKQGRRYAIVADHIIGEYQAVIKPLGKTFNHIKFLSGASLLGDGSIAILLDTDKLWYEISE